MKWIVYLTEATSPASKIMRINAGRTKNLSAQGKKG
jgi:hypothetical protein